MPAFQKFVCNANVGVFGRFSPKMLQQLDANIEVNQTASVLRARVRPDMPAHLPLRPAHPHRAMHVSGIGSESAALLRLQARSEIRSKEIVALGETLKILTEDSARDLYAKSTMVFLQERRRVIPERPSMADERTEEHLAMHVGSANP